MGVHLRLLSDCRGALFSSCSWSVHQYVEDFTTKDYCDTLEAVAFRDTGAGELGLDPFEIEILGSCSTYCTARNVVVAGDLAYGGTRFGLDVCDIGDLADPTIREVAGEGLWNVDAEVLATRT